MAKFFELVTQRRLWVAAIPVVIIVGQMFGIEFTEALLNDTFDKVVAGGMSVLALWSYLAPKPV